MVLMWPIIAFIISIEFLVWIFITILFINYNHIKEKFFEKNTVIKDANNRINELKMVKYKSLNEQKDYLRAKNDSGKDFINMVASLILFILFFKYFFIPKMPNLYIGLGIIVIVASAVAFVNSLMYTKNIQQYQFISSLLGFLYGGTLLLYINFIHVEYPIILIIFILITFIIFEPVKVWFKKNILMEG